MSYYATISFKTIKAEELYSAFLQLKEVVQSKFKAIANDEYIYMPTVRYAHLYKDASDYVRSEANRRWATGSVFTYRYFYLPDHNLLGVFGVPDAVQDVFDATCYFQNSCDQDYRSEDWKGVPLFEEIFDKWKNATDEAVKKHYETKYEEEWEEGLDYNYFRRTFAYDEIWGLCEKYLFCEESVVYLTLFGFYDGYKVNSFIKLCEKQAA